MPELNVSLLEDVAGAIAMNPGEFDMAEWCGTSRCIAGWTVLLAEERGMLIMPAATKAGIRHSVRMEGSTVHVEEAARQLLGLTASEALDLFYMRGSLGKYAETEDFRAVTADEARDYIKNFIEEKQNA